MPTEYGADAQITGSLEVDGDIELGSGDDNVTMDSETLFVDGANDRIGIGTTSPNYKLHVHASAADTTSQITAYFRSEDTDYSRISVDSTANADTQISFMNNGSSKWSIGNEATGDSFHITSGFGPFDSDNPLIISSAGDTTFSGNTSLDGGYVIGNESLTSANNGGSMSSTIPLSVVTNMGGALSVTLGNASTNGQRKKILCTGYNSSASLVVNVSSASWAMGSPGSMTISASAVFIDLVWMNSAWWIIGSSPAGISYA
tara:strand:- start:203 stop:982 length:780 start_codon:yes stop_codon:yes gene_type:complete